VCSAADGSTEERGKREETEEAETELCVNRDTEDTGDGAAEGEDDDEDEDEFEFGFASLSHSAGRGSVCCGRAMWPCALPLIAPMGR
jgi:hypothetical protein